MKRFNEWIRGAWKQIILVSLIATLSRGTLNALNAVGGLGTGDVQTATMVNLLSSISFTMLSWSSGGIVNLLGYRISCSIGSLTTTITLTTLLLFTMYHLIPPMCVWVAATLDGLGSGVLWTASGTILIKYPPQDQKGFASTVLFAIYSCGAAMGGLLSFALNIHSNDSTTVLADPGNIPPSAEDGFPLQPVINTGLKPASYSLMISLAVVALFLCVFIVDEYKVIRQSHSNVSEALTEQREPSRFSSVSQSHSAFRLFALPNSPQSHRPLPAVESSTSPAQKSVVRSMSKMMAESTSQQLRQLGQAFQERSVQFLVIYSFASLFHQTYLFNGINYKAFNVRTRGLNCFMYWVGRIPAGFIHGHLVDDVKFTTRLRALHGLTLLLTYVATCQCLAVIFWTAVPEGVFDVVVDPSNTALAFSSFFLYGGLDTVSQSFVLWIFSCLARRHPSRVSHYVAIFRCFQGLGSSLAWALDLNSFASYRTQFLVCAACWMMALPGLGWVIMSLPNDDAAIIVKQTDSGAPTTLDSSTQPSTDARALSEEKRSASDVEIVQV